MPQLTKTKDIIWLAGLLEGEGCFRLSDGKYPAIIVNMTDEDIIVKVSDIWDTRVTRNKNLYRAQISGPRAIGWMMVLYVLLGKRRRKKVTSIIKFWKETNYKAPHGMRFMAKCHAGRLVHGYGLCRPCYMKQYYVREKEKQLLRRTG